MISFRLRIPHFTKDCRLLAAGIVHLVSKKSDLPPGAIVLSAEEAKVEAKAEEADTLKALSDSMPEPDLNAKTLSEASKGA